MLPSHGINHLQKFLKLLAKSATYFVSALGTLGGIFGLIVDGPAVYDNAEKNGAIDKIHAIWLVIWFLFTEHIIFVVLGIVATTFVVYLMKARPQRALKGEFDAKRKAARMSAPKVKK